MIRLTREVRFTLGAPPQLGGANGFAGIPAMSGSGQFVVLRCTCAGEPDGESGYLLNITAIDGAVRQRVIPLLQRAWPGAWLAELPKVVESLRDGVRPATIESVELRPSPYTSLSMQTAGTQTNSGLVTQGTRFEFSASHRLHCAHLSDVENRELFGKCNNPAGHGHNYELEVTVQGAPDGTGLILPYLQLEAVVQQHVIAALDHTHLNTQVPEFTAINPSVENIARVIYDRLEPHLQGKLGSVTVWETPKTSARYSRG